MQVANNVPRNEYIHLLLAIILIVTLQQFLKGIW